MTTRLQIVVSQLMSALRERTTLGSEIRRLRLEAEFTLRGFAKMLGHTAAHQSDIEHGRRMPSEEVLRRTVDALAHVGANYDELKELDTRLGRDLEEWIQEHPAARALLRESKASGRSARELLEEFRNRGYEQMQLLSSRASPAVGSLADESWRYDRETIPGGASRGRHVIYSEANIPCARHVCEVIAERDAEECARLIAAAPAMRDLLRRALEFRMSGEFANQHAWTKEVEALLGRLA